MRVVLEVSSNPFDFPPTNERELQIKGVKSLRRHVSPRGETWEFAMGSSVDALALEETTGWELRGHTLYAKCVYGGLVEVRAQLYNVTSITRK